MMSSIPPPRHDATGHPPFLRLGIVIITRNEEENIGRCIRSILDDLAGRPAEVVVVDSASTDRTVEIAQSYPVTVIRIAQTAELSPSAGRHIGTTFLHQEFVQFFDGDMEVIPGWFDEAFAALADRAIAGVAGRRYRVRFGHSPSLDMPDGYPLGSIGFLGAAGLYRLEALRHAGGFNPFVKGEEEQEVGFRITRAGYRLIKIAQPMVYHYDKARVASEVDEKAGHFYGVGQVLRAYPGTAIVTDVLRRQGRVLRSALVVVGGSFVGLLLLASGPPGVRWGLVSLLFLGLLIVLGTGKFKKLLLYLRFRFLLFWHILRGFLRGIPPASSYRADTSVLKPPTNS